MSLFDDKRVIIVIGRHRLKLSQNNNNKKKSNPTYTKNQLESWHNNKKNNYHETNVIDSNLSSIFFLIKKKFNYSKINVNTLHKLQST